MVFGTPFFSFVLAKFSFIVAKTRDFFARMSEKNPALYLA
jgi:hypothetical protein